MGNIKYLYGEKKYLNQIITGEGIIQFDHISYYAFKENKDIRDDELRKYLHFNNNNTSSISISLNNHEIKEFSFKKSEEAEIIFKPVSCFVKCFSNKPFALELYDRFKADICLEVDINKLVAGIKAVLERNYPAIESRIIHKDVTYYSDISDFDKFNGKMNTIDFAFLKPASYSIEDEYRVIILFKDSSLHNNKESLRVSVPPSGNDYYYINNYKEYQIQNS